MERKTVLYGPFMKLCYTCKFSCRPDIVLKMSNISYIYNGDAT